MSTSTSNVQHLVDRKGRLWQERTIVVKPDKGNGYGFSLSGEKPVFVGGIVDNGPAYQAGIRKNDRIIKVDGSSVFDKQHDEVVVLLKGAASVSLTMIRAITAKGSSGKESSATAPQLIQELTLNNLKSMVQKQQRHYEQLTIDYARSPSERLEKEIKDCEQIIRSLMGEIAVKSNSSIEGISQTTEGKIESLLGPEKAIDRPGRLARDDSMLAHKILSTITDNSQLSQATPNFSEDSSNEYNSSTPTNTTTNNGGGGGGKRPSSPSKYKSPKAFRRSSISKLLTLSTSNTNDTAASNSGSSSPTKGHLQRSLTELNDSDLSDEDLEFGTPHYGPFSSLQELNNYPAHLSVFLHYLIMNKDPRYLCFYLVARSYQNYYKGTEMRLKAMEILWTFCLSTSPLYVQLTDQVLQRILEVVDTEENETKLKSVFVEARDVVASQIAEDLTEFRHKRTLGLGSLYGEQKLTDNMTNAREIDVANSTLGKVMKSLSNEKFESIQTVNRNQALCDSLTTFLSDVGRIKSKSDSTLSERAQSFTRYEPKRNKKLKKINKCGHTLQLTTYTQTTICNHCDRVLWGVGFHGFQCGVCEMNFHRYGCIDERIETCKKEKRRTLKKPIGPMFSIGNNFSTAPQPETSDKVAETTHSDEHEILEEEDEQLMNMTRGRLRSVSDPKNTLLKVQLEKEEEIVKEQIFQKKHKSSVTVNRTQSLKERTRSNAGTGELGQPQSSQDTSLNTTPSWNSVASSTSDESLNMSATATFGGVGTMTKSSTLDTVIEGGKVVSMEDHILQELQDANVESELIPWRLTTPSNVVKGLLSFEIQRQELLKELIHTERTHRKKLLIMKHIYKTPLCRQKIITYQQAEMIFPSLEELVRLHNDFCDEMRARQSMYADGVIKGMADVLLRRFDGQAGEKLCMAVSEFAANQSRATQKVREFSKAYPNFKKFLQDAESDPYCNRLKLQELVPIVWTRLTRYQLLIENICKLNKKNKEKIKDEDKEEVELMETALERVKNVCKFVNKKVKQDENHRHLRDYQTRLDFTYLDKTTNPFLAKYKDLDLTAENRKLLHEGVLNWKISQRKNPLEVRALLLTDILVLLSKAEDGSERLFLKTYHTDTISGGGREEISPVIRLEDLMFRDRADKIGRTFLIVNTSSLLKFAQMYEFTAESKQEKKKWEKSIENATSSALQNGSDFLSPEPHSPGPEDTFTRTVAVTPLMSNVTLRDQLNKIDDDIQRLMEEKLGMLKALQGDRRDSSVLTLTPPADKEFDTVKDYTCGVLYTVTELNNQVSKLMVPNPTKYIVADVQHQLTELSSNLHRNLSHIVLYLNDSLGNSNSALLLDSTNVSSENITNSSSRDHFSPVLESKIADSPPPHYEHIYDTTISPSDDSSSSITNHVMDNTPKATPLPNDNYRIHPVAKEGGVSNSDTQPVNNDTTGSVPSLPPPVDDDSGHGYNQQDDDDEPPPPLPMEPPPPSSTSASSQTTNPDIDDDDFPSLLPPLPNEQTIPHSVSSLSEEFHTETSIVQPPEGFLSSSPNKTRHYFTVASEEFSNEDSENDGYNNGGNQRMVSSSSKENSPGSFRRVRSNPSLSSLKVKMSVINSSGDPVSSLTNIDISDNQSSVGGDRGSETTPPHGFVPVKFKS